MNDGLTERLNQILLTITSDAFLRGKGLGNEIAFYIFDYPPEAELRVALHRTVVQLTCNENGDPDILLLARCHA